MIKDNVRIVYMTTVSCPLKAYRDILGKPNKGVHKYTFLNTAIVDYVLTIIGACITSYMTSMPLPLTTVIWFVMGFISHIVFGVETTTLRYLGIRCS